jgi:hypothetical protein
MNRTALAAITVTLFFAGQCTAQNADVLRLIQEGGPELPESRYEKRLSHLQDKQTWDVLTANGIEKISGDFCGICNDHFYIRDKDGIDYKVPIDALVDSEHKYLDSFRDWTGTNMPAEHQRRIEQSPQYAQYVYDRESRRRDALVARKEYNASKGPARGWTAMAVPFNAAMPFGSAIQGGLLRQPPIR